MIDFEIKKQIKINYTIIPEQLREGKKRIYG